MFIRREKCLMQTNCFIGVERERRVGTELRLAFTPEIYVDIASSGATLQPGAGGCGVSLESRTVPIKYIIDLRTAAPRPTEVVPLSTRGSDVRSRLRSCAATNFTAAKISACDSGFEQAHGAVAKNRTSKRG